MRGEGYYSMNHGVAVRLGVSLCYNSIDHGPNDRSAIGSASTPVGVFLRHSGSSGSSSSGPGRGFERMGSLEGRLRENFLSSSELGGQFRDSVDALPEDHPSHSVSGGSHVVFAPVPLNNSSSNQQSSARTTSNAQGNTDEKQDNMISTPATSSSSTASRASAPAGAASVPQPITELHTCTAVDALRPQLLPYHDAAELYRMKMQELVGSLGRDKAGTNRTTIEQGKTVIMSMRSVVLHLQTRAPVFL